MQSIEENGGYYLDDGTWVNVGPAVSLFDLGGTESSVSISGLTLSYFYPENVLVDSFIRKTFPALTTGIGNRIVVNSTGYSQVGNEFTGFTWETNDLYVTYNCYFETDIPLAAILGTVMGKFQIKYGMGNYGSNHSDFEEVPVSADIRIYAGESVYSFSRSCNSDGILNLSWAAPDGGYVEPISKLEINWNFQSLNQSFAAVSAFDHFALYWYMLETVEFRDSQTNADSSQVIINQNETSNNLLSQLVSDIGNLGSTIVDGLVDGLVGLFVPSAEDLEEINTNWQSMLETKLGFVWQAGTELIAIANAVIDEMEGGTPYAFVFPGISFPQDGEELVILPEMEVSLENDFMDVVRPILASVTIAVCVIAFINTAESMLAAIVSGASYYQFLHRKE